MAQAPPTTADGRYDRAPSTFRDTIGKGGKFEPEAGRYRLYVSYGCPWATRALIFCKLKGLEDLIPVTTVAPHLGENGWAFAKVDSYPGADEEPLYGASYIKELYFKANPEFIGRFTVPVLWDTKHETIVNNESSEIIRIFNSAFDDIISDKEKASLDFYPKELHSEIDGINEWVYKTVNNGVYRAGFATSAAAYEEAVYALFESLDRLETILKGKDYLVGDTLTEADVRLFVTIIRFDVAYFTHFKCNIRDIRNGYPAIHLWLRKLYWNNPAFKDSTKFDHIKDGYFSSHRLNPTKIVPVGPLPHIQPL